MNKIEKKMVQILIDLREHHHVVGIKAEFEAEGTRMEEALRLKEVISAASLGLTLKIGGCEAVRDIYEARVIGVQRIVAPMIETPFALQKFLRAFALAVPADEHDDIKVAVNIETIDACRNFERMLAVDGVGALESIVLGRVDLTGSMGLDRDAVNSKEVAAVAAPVFALARQHKLAICVGGGVSMHSVPMFRELLPDRYETRKVIFACPAALGEDAQVGIMKAIQFELCWLQNKRDFYGIIHREDEQRITMLETRYRKVMTDLGITP